MTDTMTNKEAIDILRVINPPRESKRIFGEFIQARNMAISALKFKENYDKFAEHVKAEGMRGREVEVRHGGRVFRVKEVAQ